MILYILLILSIILLLVYFVYKVKFPFWSRQPVFHHHNLWYWYKPPGIIQPEKPEMNKYYVPSIHFKEISKMTDVEKNEFYQLIHNNFLPYKNELYDPSFNDIFDYFKGHNNKTFISLNYKNNFKPMRNELISTMTTRPLYVNINDINFSIYYVDYLCVEKEHRKKGIAPITIYSHYLNQRYKHDNIVFLFKREGETTAIVPLMVYKLYAFDTLIWDKEAEFDEPYIYTLELNQLSSKLFVSLLKDAQEKFKCMITPFLGNVIHLTNNKQYLIYLLIYDEQPVGFYVFIDNHTTYNGKKSIELCASYCKIKKEIFVLGFLNCIKKINKVIPFDIILIEDTSDNNFILNVLMNRYKTIFESTISYYFYNYASIPYLSYEVLCIV